MTDDKKMIEVGVGMPAYLKLEAFGRVIREAFPEGTPYHVGSSLLGKEWRDVDVRLMLPDDVYEREFGPYIQPQYRNKRWNALCCAFSCYGSDMTGLPIDFQIQDHTNANLEYNNPRSALGIIPYLGKQR